MTGSGTLGEIAPGWSLSESASPVAIGDTGATTGTVSFSAHSTDESLLVINNEITSTVNDLGTISGVVQSVSETGLVTNVSHGTVADKLNLDVTVQPVPEGGPKAWCAALEYAIGVGPNPYNAPVSYVPEFAENGVSFGFFGSTLSSDYVYPLSTFLNYANGYPAVPTYNVGNGEMDSAQGIGDTTSWKSLNNTELAAINTIPDWFKPKAAIGNNKKHAVIQFSLISDSSTRVSLGLSATNIPGFSSIITVDGNAKTFSDDAGNSISYASLDLTKPLMFTIDIFPDPSTTRPICTVTDHTNTKVQATNFEPQLRSNPVYLPYHRVECNDFKFLTFYTTPYIDTSVVTLPITDYIEPADYGGTITPSLFDFTGYTGTSLAPYPSTTGVAWELLQQLASAEGFEVAVGNTQILIRDIGSTTIDITNRTVPTISPTSTLSGREIDIKYTDAEYVSGSIYDAQQDGNNIISVQAGTTTVTSVKFTTHPLTVLNPELVDGTTWPLEPGQYAVMDDTGYYLNSGEWDAYGAYVSCAIDPEDPSAIQITVKGPYTATTASGDTYKLAVADGATEYAALNIAGTGVYSGDGQLNLLTAVDPDKYTRATINTITNPFIQTQEQAYDRGVWASLKASGPVVTMTTNVPVSAITGVGLTPGALIDYNQSTYRVTNAQIGNLNVGISAERYVTVADMDAIWGSQTVADYDALWGNYECQDQIVFPYKVA